jgi:hypothetical protein
MVLGRAWTQGDLLYGGVVETGFGGQHRIDCVTNPIQSLEPADQPCRYYRAILARVA